MALSTVNPFILTEGFIHRFYLRLYHKYFLFDTQVFITRHGCSLEFIYGSTLGFIHFRQLLNVLSDDNIIIPTGVSIHRGTFARLGDYAWIQVGMMLRHRVDHPDGRSLYSRTAGTSPTRNGRPRGRHVKFNRLIGAFVVLDSLAVPSKCKRTWLSCLRSFLSLSLLRSSIVTVNNGDEWWYVLVVIHQIFWIEREGEREKQFWSRGQSVSLYNCFNFFFFICAIRIKIFMFLDILAVYVILLMDHV